jgi:hypothetical protein
MFTVYQRQMMGPNATVFALNQLDGSVSGTYNAGEVDFIGPPTVEPHQDLVFLFSLLIGTKPIIWSPSS